MITAAPPPYVPTLTDRIWVTTLFNMSADKATWAAPASGHIFALDKTAKTITLVHRDPLVVPTIPLDEFYRRTAAVFGIVGLKLVIPDKFQ